MTAFDLKNIILDYEAENRPRGYHSIMNRFYDLISNHETGDDCYHIVVDRDFVSEPLKDLLTSEGFIFSEAQTRYGAELGVDKYLTTKEWKISLPEGK